MTPLVFLLHRVAAVCSQPLQTGRYPGCKAAGGCKHGQPSNNSPRGSTGTGSLLQTNSGCSYYVVVCYQSTIGRGLRDGRRSLLGRPANDRHRRTYRRRPNRDHRSPASGLHRYQHHFRDTQRLWRGCRIAIAPELRWFVLPNLEGSIERLSPSRSSLISLQFALSPMMVIAIWIKHALNVCGSTPA